MEGHRLSIAGDVLFVFPLKDYLFHVTFALVHNHSLSGTHNSIILLLIPHGSHQATGIGGVAAARDSCAITFWSSISAGRQRLEGFGRESRLNVSRVPQGPLRFASSPETPEQRLPSWSSWRIQRWAKCKARSLWWGVWLRMRAGRRR